MRNLPKNGGSICILKMTINLSDRSEKYLERLQPKYRDRIMRAIFKLPNGDVVPMQGRKGVYRLRVGDWRILWEYQEESIFIMEIGNRGDIYR